MPDFSKMSDQELEAIASGNGSVGYQRPDVSQMSDAELYKLASGGQTPSFFDNSEAAGASELSGSPLSLIDRVKLSFADDIGREKYLREVKGYKFVERLPNGKFSVGNDPRNLQPIDPEGMFNDVIGDAADIVGEIPVIVGQIAGSIAGTAAEPGVGTVVGGGLGSAAGEAIKKGVGSAMGVNKEAIEKQAADIAISGALGSAGEAAVIGLNKFGGSIIKPGVARFFDKANKASSITEPIIDPITGAVLDPEPTRFSKIMAKIFHITAGVKEKSTLTLFKHGVEEATSNEMMNLRTAIPIVSNIKRSIGIATEKLGDAVKLESSNLAKAARNVDVDIEDIFLKLRNDLKDAEIIDDFGKSFAGKFREKEKAFFSDLLKRVENPQIIVDAKGKPVSSSVKSIKLPEALKLKSFIEDSFDTLDERSAKIAKDFLKGDSFTKTKGLRVKLREIASKPEVSQSKYIMANERFSKFKDLKDRLRQLDTKNPADAERFLKSLENQAEFTLDDLKLLQAETPHIPFLKKAEMWNAAQDFKGANPNMLRVGAILGFAGINQDQSPQGKLGRFALGAAVATPAGARMFLRGGAKIGGLGKIASSTMNPVVGAAYRASSGALLSSLLRNKPRQKGR